MKKKLISLLLVLVMPMLVLCGCGTSPEVEANGGSDRFKHICYSECCVLVDKETRVMYLWKKASYAGGLTVMVNADGSPMLYEGEL